MSEDSFTAKYKVSSNGIPQSKATVIEQLMPTFKQIAAAFSVNILVECLNGLATEIRDDIPETKVVKFHIDTFPTRFYPIVTSTAKTMFGLYPSGSTPINTFAQAQHSTYRLPKTELYSPEGQHIGHILGSHIFLHPYILTSESWSKEDRIKLLLAISYWFLPKAILNILPEHKAEIADGLKMLRSTHFRQYLSDKQRGEFQKKFETFVGHLNFKRLTHLDDQISKAEEKLETLSETYFDLLGRSVIYRKRLETIKSDLLIREFDKEFEALLIMESIETIRIPNDHCLSIKTSPIFQIPAIDHPNKIAESYDIGEFDIRINTNSLPLKRDAINFYQDKYTGPYKHTHVGSPGINVCFGTNQEEGLNTPIDNLIARLDIVPLVHLILSFLKKERSRPSERSQAPTPTNSNPSKDSYKDGEERAGEKERFIKLMSDTMLRISTADLEKQISDLKPQIISNYAEIIKAKDSIRNDESERDRLNAFLVDSIDIKKEAGYLLGEDSIFELSISEEMMLISLYYPRIYKDDESRYLSSDFILRISPDSFPKLLLPSSKKSLQEIPLLRLESLKDAVISPEDEKMVADLQNGRISEILKAVKEKIASGMFNPKPKALNTKGEGAERSEE